MIVVSNIDYYDPRGPQSYVMDRITLMYNSQATPTEIVKSFGVSSIVDVATGFHLTTFTNYFVDAVYAAQVIGLRNEHATSHSEKAASCGISEMSATGVAIQTQDNDANGRVNVLRGHLTIQK